MTEHPPIQVALSAVMAAVGAVAKKDRNEQQRFVFRGIDAVVNAVSPALRDHGVVVTPRLHKVRYETAPSKSGGTMTLCRVVVDYTFTGPAGDWIRVRVPGEAFDAGDKATPKAMSVAFRTALLQALALPTDEPDPDSQTYERADHHAPPARPAERAPDASPATVAALRKRVLEAASTIDRGRVRDDALRAVWADAVAAHAEKVFVDVPDAWASAAPEPTVRLGDLVQIARAIRIPAEES